MKVLVHDDTKKVPTEFSHHENTTQSFLVAKMTNGNKTKNIDQTFVENTKINVAAWGPLKFNSYFWFAHHENMLPYSCSLTKNGILIFFFSLLETGSPDKRTITKETISTVVGC